MYKTTLFKTSLAFVWNLTYGAVASKETICLRELYSLILKENCGKERNAVTESKQIKVLFLSLEGYFKDNIQHRADFIRLTLLQVAPLQSTITERSSNGCRKHWPRQNRPLKGTLPLLLAKSVLFCLLNFPTYDRLNRLRRQGIWFTMANQ